MISMLFRFLCLSALAWGLVGGAVTGSGAGEPPAPIRLGEIDPLSGTLALHGWEIHQGVVYAVEEINLTGGLAGRPVELVSRDDQSRPEVALTQTQDLLVREKVVGLVGGYVDSLVAPVSELAARHRTPYVAAASLLRALTQGRDNPYFFRVAKLDGILEPLTRFLTEVVKPERVAIIYMATPGSTEFAVLAKKMLEQAGIAVPLMEKCRSGSPDFSVFLLKAKSARVDAVVSGGFYPDNLILARQLRELALPLKACLAPWGVAYESFIREVGPAAEGLLGTCAWSPGITLPGTEAASAALVQGFSARFGQAPSSTTMHGYVAARALLAAVERVLLDGRALSGDEVGRELHRLDLLLPMERLQFDSRGDPRHYRQVVVQVQKGKLVPLFPPDRAGGKWQQLSY